MRTIAATAVVLASQVQDSSCSSDTTRLGWECHVNSRGLQNENGLVVDVLTYWCDQPPRQQTFTGWIDARPGPDRDWEQAGRTSIQLIPAGPKPKNLRVEAGRCQPDVEYGTMWRSEGVTADGRPFDVTPDSHVFTRDDLC